MGSVPGRIYQYRQVKIMKHARSDTNYAILTKRIKLQYEKIPGIELNMYAKCRL